VTPRVFERGLSGHGTIAIVDRPGGPPLVHWDWTDNARGLSCLELTPQNIDLGGDRLRVWLVITAEGSAVALDRTILRGR
jgi:hypothetical protein